jgi:hypothetical protein
MNNLKAQFAALSLMAQIDRARQDAARRGIVKVVK